MLLHEAASEEQPRTMSWNVAPLIGPHLGDALVVVSWANDPADDPMHIVLHFRHRDKETVTRRKKLDQSLRLLFDPRPPSDKEEAGDHDAVDEKQHASEGVLQRLEILVLVWLLLIPEQDSRELRDEQTPQRSELEQVETRQFKGFDLQLNHDRDDQHNNRAE